MKLSAGLAILYKGKILLVHPTNASWQKTFSIPKGELRPKESYFIGALRETAEEVGIELGDGWVDPKVNIISYQDKNGKVYKKVYWLVADISKIDFKYIESLYPVLPKEQLQQDEVDWAGFVDKEKAYELILPKQIPILDKIYG